MITDDSDLKGFMQHLIKVVVKQTWDSKQITKLNIIYFFNIFYLLEIILWNDI
jgi:hypothetical protein